MKLTLGTFALTAVVLLLPTAAECQVPQPTQPVGGHGDGTAVNPKETQSENKALGLSGITSDTLTFKQFSEVKALTVDDPTLRITDWDLGFFKDTREGQTLYTFSMTGDGIPGETLLMVLDAGAHAVLIENVAALRGLERVNLGHRWFHLK